MTFALITHVVHFPKDGQLWAYGPYVREMNIWGRHVDRIILVAPAKKGGVDPIDLAYQQENITWLKVPSFAATSSWQKFRSLFVVPWVLIQIFRACWMSDHIHLRAPGNMAILGLLVQTLFPHKKKTAKYAGNWDPNAEQPNGYIWQKKKLADPKFARNMQVLVYGAYPDQSENVLPFFTATYPKPDQIFETRPLGEKVRMLFVGSLSLGKRPAYALELFKNLSEQNLVHQLEFFGSGVEGDALKEQVEENGLQDKVIFHGNQPSDKVKEAFQTADFMILPSKSEGWPKVVAEAMYWGCIPMVTPISCVVWMLAYGRRGLLLELDTTKDAAALAALMAEPSRIEQMRSAAANWSRKYTLEYFDSEIQKLL